jgi:hypothetical protein
MITLPHTTNPTERVLRVRFYLPAYPFLRSSLFQITTGTTTTDTAHPDTTTDGTATAVIVTGTGIAMKGATGTEVTTANVIDGMTRGGLEGTREDGDTDGNAKRGRVQGARTTCKSTALQRATAETVVVTVIGDATPNVGGTGWVLLNEGVPPPQMRSSSL